MTEQQFKKSLEFFARIGIEVREQEFSAEQDRCVPGISCEGGVLAYDHEKLEFPGDLYYVAARIAVTSPEDRAQMDNALSLDAALEMTALAWAFAASQHVGVEPEIVFHPSGYHGQSQDLIRAYQSGVAPGVPMLIYFEMAKEFPQVTSWLRPSTPSARS